MGVVCLAVARRRCWGGVASIALALRCCYGWNLSPVSGKTPPLTRGAFGGIHDDGLRHPLEVGRGVLETHGHPRPDERPLLRTEGGEGLGIRLEAAVVESCLQVHLGDELAPAQSQLRPPDISGGVAQDLGPLVQRYQVLDYPVPLPMLLPRNQQEGGDYW